jgi:hypothetical protein
MFSSFVHKLEACVLRKPDPLILWSWPPPCLLICGSLGVSSVDVRNGVGLDPFEPFNLCDIHVPSSDSSWCASIGLMTWPCMHGILGGSSSLVKVIVDGVKPCPSSPQAYE